MLHLLTFIYYVGCIAVTLQCRQTKNLQRSSTKSVTLHRQTRKLFFQANAKLE